jgi:predicted MFS family arabinose efflux permease
MASVALFTIMMDACTDAAGTEYTLQASVVVIATGLAQALSGFVADALGYAGHFMASAFLSALGLAFTARALAAGRVPPAPSLDAAKAAT